MVELILNYRRGWELPFQNEAGIGLEEVDILIGDNKNVTPLMVAVKGKHLSVVKLLTAGSALNSSPNIAIPLRYRTTKSK